MIKMDHHLKILIAALGFALLAYGLNPWTNPANAATERASAQSGDNPKNNCSEILANSKNNQKTLATLERLVGYLESSVTDVKMTVNRIDRNLNKANKQSPM